MRPWALVMALAAGYGALAQTTNGQTITVRIVNSITGAPIAGANVVFNGAAGRLWGRTDLAGRFTGKTQSSGKAMLTVTKPGFRMTGAGILGKVIQFEKGIEAETTVKLLPLGVIAGRVVDQYGDPVRHASVSALKKRDSPEQGVYYQHLASAISDDRGEYRMADVEPEAYYIAAEYSDEHQHLLSAARSRFRWPDMGGFVLFPHTTDIAHARQLEVAAGQTVRMEDLRLTMLPAVSIRGRIADFSPSERAQLNLRRAGPYLSLNVFAGRGTTVDADGGFEFKVLPGTYVLQAGTESGKGSPDVTIRAETADVNGLELKLGAGYEISGQIRIDGPERLDFSKFVLGFMGPQVEIDEAGKFRAAPASNKLRFSVHGLPDGWYIKQVLVGGRPITGKYFEIGAGATEMSFLLSPRGARVECTVEPSGEEFAYVLLLPEDGPIPDIESVLHAERARSGATVIRGVPPGSYRVFALDSANWPMMMRPDLLMEKYGKPAPRVTVGEGERNSIALPLTKIQPE